MYNIAILDNSDVYYFLESLLTTISKELMISVNICKIQKEDIVNLSNFNYDILYLNMYFNREVYFSVLKNIQKSGHNVKVIFTTSYSCYLKSKQIPDFKYVQDYISQDIKNLLLQLQIKGNSGHEQIFLACKERQALIKIELQSIYYIEFQERKANIHTIYGNQLIKIRMKDLVESIEHVNFFHCHKSYIVNFAHVYKTKGFIVLMLNGDTIPISQLKKSKFSLAYKDYLNSL